jgi:hypothetical protein
MKYVNESQFQISNYFKKDILQNILNFLPEYDFKNILKAFSKNKYLKDELKFILYKNLLYFNNDNIDCEYYSNYYSISYEKIILKKIIDNNVFSTIKNSFFNLKNLYFFFGSDDNYSMSILQYCKELTTLSLIGNSSITDNTLRCISKNCLKLENIYLNYCENITYNGVNNILLSCKNLKNIEFSGKNINNTFLVNISDNFSRLESLKLKYCYDISDFSINNCFLKTKLKLKHLDLTGCSNDLLSENSIVNIVRKCNNLESIILQNCKNVNNNVIINLINNCSNLKCINLIGCAMINSESIKFLFEKCLKLETISLCENNKLNDSILNNLNKTMNLKEIYFLSIRSITDKGLINLINNSPFLEKIKIPRCINISDFFLEEISKKFPKIKHIDISFCNKITDYGVNILLKNCLKLTNFNLFKIDNLKNNIENFKKIYPKIYFDSIF